MSRGTLRSQEDPCLRLTAGASWIAFLACAAAAGGVPAGEAVDFNRDIRPILAANCFACHGPDHAKRKAGLRLDEREGATAERDGVRAVVPGEPSKSDLVRRVTAEDPSERMPPPSTGKKLNADQARLLARWVKEGAPYADHWAYVRPVRPPLPDVRDGSWPRNALDRFILARLEKEGLAPSPEADRHALVRRLSLDVTGLPPTLEEVEEFVSDTSPDAYDRLVDRVLSRPAYGEHWARMWLDLARYADSAGYADDPPRTIWAYRDYVVDSFNADKPFDQFTIEQIAGDLLPDPTEEQLIATGFHRNTQTNSEGGTLDEEFRSVAVVDRVNTTLAVWMGTTMACAQCHNHKYDPITQEEYFRFYAFFNNTRDADLADESPILPLYSAAEKERKARLERDVARLEEVLRTPTPRLSEGQARWEAALLEDLPWQTLQPREMTSRAEAGMKLLEDGSVLVAEGGTTDVYRLVLPLPEGKLTAVRLEALPHPSLPEGGPGHGGGNFVLTRVVASLLPPDEARITGRYVRVEIPGKEKTLSLAEVQVFACGENAALRGEARQSSTAADGLAHLAIDGNTDGRYSEAKSTTHTAASEGPWWEVDLKEPRPIERIVLWNRTDSGLHTRLKDFRLLVLDEDRRAVLERNVAEPPNPMATFAATDPRGLALVAGHADFWQPGFEPDGVLGMGRKKEAGWAVGGQLGKAHALTLIPGSPAEVAPGTRLDLSIEQLSSHERHTLGRLRVSATADGRAGDLARVPPRILASIKTPPAERGEEKRAELARFYLASIAPELEPSRRELASLAKELADLKPATTVPVLRELPPEGRRKTHVQYRGNFLDLGKEVSPGVPSTFHRLPESMPPDRLALARWLVDEKNPLTARVVVNLYWERLFGTGIVATSEEFGTQGELPSHPELLDWLASELMADGWKLKGLLRRLVTSATYRQSSRVSPDLLERDPQNRLLARGPRFRLPAEEIRDQALFVAGLLSLKMRGPPVRPPQPEVGLTAAFGGGIDWKTSEGEDRYRRGIYTTWRRSSPYPSMTTFDAPNREVCALRRARTNTPLQALVTLNDPVFVEAAQGLARRMDRGGRTVEEKARYGFRVALCRTPEDKELKRLVRLFEDARDQLALEPDKALRLATAPLGPPAEGADVVALAAWTVVGNVLLNLDETLMKR